VVNIVDQVGTELCLKPFLQNVLVQQSPPSQEFHIEAIARTISAEFREHEIMDFEGEEPETSEALGSQISQSRSVSLRILCDCYRVKMQSVSLGDLASFACNPEEFPHGSCGRERNEVDIPRG